MNGTRITRITRMNGTRITRITRMDGTRITRIARGMRAGQIGRRQSGFVNP
jgi:hypothetical protein